MFYIKNYIDNKMTDTEQKHEIQTTIPESSEECPICIEKFNKTNFFV